MRVVCKILALVFIVLVIICSVLLVVKSRTYKVWRSARRAPTYPPLPMDKVTKAISPSKHSNRDVRPAYLSVLAAKRKELARKATRAEKKKLKVVVVEEHHEGKIFYT